jgi:hypothetical protein
MGCSPVGILSPQYVGLGIGVAANKQPSFAGALQAAFQNAGVPMTGFIDASATNMVLIRVGANPPY